MHLNILKIKVSVAAAWVLAVLSLAFPVYLAHPHAHPAREFFLSNEHRMLWGDTFQQYLIGCLLALGVIWCPEGRLSFGRKIALIAAISALVALFVFDKGYLWAKPRPLVSPDEHHLTLDEWIEKRAKEGRPLTADEILGLDPASKPSKSSTK